MEVMHMIRSFNFIFENRLISVKADSLEKAQKKAQQIADNLVKEEK